MDGEPQEVIECFRPKLLEVAIQLPVTPSPISIILFVHTDTASDGATFFPHCNFFSSSLFFFLFLFLYGAFARLRTMATPLPGLSDNWACKTWWCQPHTPPPFSAVVASFACPFILRSVIRSHLILQPFKTQRQQFWISRESKPNTGVHFGIVPTDPPYVILVENIYSIRRMVAGWNCSTFLPSILRY